MDDILVRIDRSSVDEESGDLICRLIDCKLEIERLRATLAELHRFARNGNGTLRVETVSALQRELTRGISGQPARP